MRAGKLATVRVNPQDCMGIVDVLTKLGVSTDNLSFSQATKIVLASALESFRQNGAIPTRDGFEYSAMMAPFAVDDYSTHAKRLQATHNGNQPAFTPPTMPVGQSLLEAAEHRAKRVRFDELMFRRTADPTNFTDADLVELAPLLEEFQT